MNFVRDAEGPNSTACAGIPPTAYLASACKPGDSAAPTQTADGKACASITLTQKAGINLHIIRIALETNLKINPKIDPALHHTRIYLKIRKSLFLYGAALKVIKDEFLTAPYKKVNPFEVLDRYLD